MERIEITGLTVAELQHMLDNAVENALRKIKEENSKPSDWEDITVEKAARELDCSMRTIRRRMKELKIKGFRVGKQVTIQRKDLDKIRKSSRLPNF